MVLLSEQDRVWRQEKRGGLEPALGPGVSQAGGRDRNDGSQPAPDPGWRSAQQ